MPLILSLLFATQALGEMRGLVFFHGDEGPAEGVVVRWGAGEVRSDKDGAFLLRAPLGQLTLELTLGKRRWSVPEVPLRAGARTEVIINLPADHGPAKARVEFIERALVGDDPSKQVSRGLLTGRVTDEKQGSPIVNARLFVRGDDQEAKTDKDGIYRLQVPRGGADIMVLARGYATANLKGIDVNKDKPTIRNIKLEAAGVSLAAFTVTAPRIEGSTTALLEERRQGGAVADLLGAEQMSQSGDSDAAAAMRRVTGVTIVGGRFIYVRGLGERYSSTLMDRTTLPSPDPERRVVPLDLFPTDFLGSIKVQKSWTSDQPGDFGGGLVELRTRNFPKRFTGSIGLSVGARLGTHDVPLLIGPHGPTDFLGFDGRFRALPPVVREASEESPLLQRDMFSTKGYTGDELESLGEAMNNQWEVSEEIPQPDFGLTATLGTPFLLFNKSGGWMAALTYGNAWSNIAKRMNIFTMGSGTLEKAHSYDFVGSNRNIPLGALLTAGVDLSKTENVRTTTMLVRISDDEVFRYEGFNRDVDTKINVTRLRWLERTLFSQQFEGAHGLDALGKGALLRWRINGALAARGEPDRRQVRYDFEAGGVGEPGSYSLSDRPDGNRRVFSSLSELNFSGGFDLDLPLSWFGGLKDKAMIGMLGGQKDRAVSTRRYRFFDKGDLAKDEAVLALPPSELFLPQYIGPDGFQLQETTLETDNYTGLQQVAAGYFLVDVRPLEKLRIVTGVRAEYGLMRMSTFQPFDPDARPISGELTNLDWLPSFGLSYDLSKRQILRFALARTVSRPDLREISPATYNEVTGGRQLFGNPDLKRALLTHADIRWEWFPSPGQVFALSAFYKHFDEPIEAIVIPSAQLSVSFANADQAQNTGAEFELRQNLGILHSSLKPLTVAANAAIIRSQVTLPEGETIQTSKERPLQGQSPYVANGQLIFEKGKRKRRLTATLVYNIFGRRITEVGGLGAPDTYEEAFHQLDLVMSQKLPAELKLSFKAKNLLDPEQRISQGREDVMVRRKGRRFSLGITKNF